jgi:hypothetical protein
MQRPLALSLFVFTLTVSACTSTTTKTRVVNTDTSSVADSGSTGTDGADGASGMTTSTDGNTTATDGVDGTDGAEGATGTDSETSATDAVDGAANLCGVEGEGKGIGEPCTSHSECATGYCYDEEYLNEDGGSTYRFCTAKCAGCTTVGNCNDWPLGPGVQANTCYIFKTAFINEYNIQADSLCLPTCSNDNDCIGLGPFSKCDKVKYSWSDGEECFGGVQKVCQPPEFVGPECD